jgi:indolepyruvate ferredoxin oxidoreductase beta subunit
MIFEVQKSISVAIVAMGGQGGGVLSNWIVALAERGNCYVQATSVPGVAQRTGSTVYYVEIIPKSADAEVLGNVPVMSLMPTPGDVDIVIAGELIEAGRSITRGFSTPDVTTLIGSTHRDYALSEKIIMTDGRVDSGEILDACRKYSKALIAFDMAEVAAKSGSVISSIMYGALAASGALPFDRDEFEKVIREGGTSVELNLQGFDSGYAAARVSLSETEIAEPGSAGEDSGPVPVARHPGVQRLLEIVKTDFPESAHAVLVAAIRRLIDYQDVAYAKDYLDLIGEIHAFDKGAAGPTRDYELTRETGRYLALWMSYEDAIRVADLKTREKRFTRVNDEIQAEVNQIVQVREFMHPRVEEICDVMPAGLGAWILKSETLSKIITAFCGPRQVRTSSIFGFGLLYSLAWMYRWRRSSYRYTIERGRIAEWLQSIKEVAGEDYELALQLCECQRMVKGYGDTYHRGFSNFTRIYDLLPRIHAIGNPAAIVKTMREAALSDEQGIELENVIASYSIPLA